MLPVKLLTIGILETKDTKDLIERIISDYTSDIAEEQIKKYRNGKSEIEEFRKTLENLAIELAKEQADITTAKVVIIVDELDRCRPSYAVQLLERIKHLFDVPGIIFILGMDRSQLNHSIRTLYGLGFDANGYLRRFIDLDYKLPEPKQGDYCSYLFKYFGIADLVLNKREKDRTVNLESLKNIIGGLMSASKISLRGQEQTIARLKIILQTIPLTEVLFPLTLGVILFLREWDNEKYTAISERSIDIDALVDSIKALPNINQVSKKCQQLIEAILLKSSEELKLPSARFEKYKSYISNSNSIPVGEQSEEDKEICQTIQYLSHQCNFEYNSIGVEVTIKRINLTNNFVMQS